MTFTESMQGLTPHIELTIQGTQKEYPIVVHKETKDKKARNKKGFINDVLKVTGQSTHKIEPGNAFQMKGALTKKE